MNKTGPQGKAKTKHDSSAKQKVDTGDAIDSPCPYCLDPDLFDKRLASTSADRYEPASILRVGSHFPKGKKPIRRMPRAQYARWGVIDRRVVVSLKTLKVIRGKIHVITITDADMVKQYSGFRVQVIGTEWETEPPHPSGAFFTRTWTEHEGKPTEFILYNAARITREGSGIVVDSHWHPSHGRKVTLRGFSQTVTTREELSVITTALSFDKKMSTRGAPLKVLKVNEEAVVNALRAQGEAATQKSVAEAAGVSVNTFRDWLYFSFGGTWYALKKDVLGGNP